MTATVTGAEALARPRPDEEDGLNLGLAGEEGAGMSAEDAGARLRKRRLLTAACILAYVTLAVLVFAPVSPLNSHELPSAVPNNPAGSDPFQMTWFLAWVPYALSHGLNVFHTTNFDYPLGVNLADNTSVPALGFVAWPITATLGPIASFNFLLRLAFALNGISMFGVLRRWTSSLVAPFLGGLLYAFGPYMTGQELHLDLVMVPIPPLLVWCADELLRTQRMRPWRLGLLIGVISAVQLLISPDIFSGCLLLAGGSAVVLAIRFRHEVRAKLAYVVRAGAVAGAAFVLLDGFLIYEMVLGANHPTGAVIPAQSLQVLHADLLGTVVPTANQLFFPHFISRFGTMMVSSNLSENVTYLGIPLLVLLWGVVRRSGRHPIVRPLAWLVAVSFLISLGSQLGIAKYFKHPINTHVPLPEAIFAHLPLLENTIPARYGLYVAVFATMIFGIGVDRLWARRGQGGSVLSAKWLRRLGRLGADTPGARRARVGLASAAVVVSLFPTIPFHSKPVPWPTSLPATIKADVPKGSVILTYPFPTPINPQAMVWEAQAGMDYRLMGGYANVEYAGQGRRWPELLSPSYVQEILAYEPVGDRWPAPGPVNAIHIRALRQFVVTYGVGAVVYSFEAGGTSNAFSYLQEGLGAPQVITPSFAIWLPAHGHWHLPGAA